MRGKKGTDCQIIKNIGNPLAQASKLLTGFLDVAHDKVLYGVLAFRKQTA